jgi:4-hydroxy-3-methylbut-2-en-1-yl diphosphate synthase IspG/GcpE
MLATQVRINPGNFADGAKKFTEIVYDSQVTKPGILLLLVV